MFDRLGTSARVYGGVEFGWVPGVALTIGGAFALGVLGIALAAGNYD